MKSRIQPLISADKNLISLNLVISNGNPVCETRLQFDFNRSTQNAAVWIARLPLIRNRDASPVALNKKLWELRLEAIHDTKPIEVTSYGRANVQAWLKEETDRNHPPHTELFIFATPQGFNITISQKI